MLYEVITFTKGLAMFLTRFDPFKELRTLEDRINEAFAPELT